MRKKLYTAFLSSNYSELKEERTIAIGKLLDADFFPVTMEHFVVASTDGFKDICELIDDSDVFILLLGTRYGSRDKRDNKSWTEKEFEYARKNDKKMLIIKLESLKKLTDVYSDDMTDEEVCTLCPIQSADDTRAQLRFARSISNEMATSADSLEKLSNVIGKFLNTARNHDDNVAGWIRDVSKSEIEEILPLDTSYYHCHLCNTQPNYLRVGEIKITRGDDGGYNLHFDGWNYKGKVVDGKIILNETKYTKWSGNYVLDPDKKTLQGIYSALKTDVDSKGERVIKSGTRDGIHRFAITGEDGECFIHGTSQDAMTEDRDGKECNISIFKTREARDKYVLKYFEDED